MDCSVKLLLFLKKIQQLKSVVSCNTLSGTCHGKINEPGIMPYSFINTILNLKEKVQIISSFVICSLNAADNCYYIGSVFVTSSKSVS